MARQIKKDPNPSDNSSSSTETSKPYISTRKAEVKSSKPNFQLIAIVIVGLIVLGGIIFLLINSSTPTPVIQQQISSNTSVPITPVNNGSNVVTSEPVFVCDDNCLFQNATLNVNATLCGYIQNNTLQQDCYIYLSNESLEACGNVTNTSVQFNCITNFAKSQSNPSLCDLLPSNVTSDCLAASDPCLSTSDPDLCDALRTNETSECGSDSNCLFNYSITRDNPSDCQLIPLPAQQTACTSILAQMDSCANLSNSAESDYCNSLYGVALDDPSACDAINPNDTTYSTVCYGAIAADSNSLSVCTDHFTLDNLWDCYTEFSLQSGNLSGCMAINTLAEIHQFDCVFNYSKTYGNPSACEVLPDLTDRSTCDQGVLYYNNNNINPNDCGNISDVNYRDRCYLDAAQITGNTSYCSFASSPSLCLNLYDQNVNITTDATTLGNMPFNG